MKWIKFTLTTTTEAVDLVSAALDELGIEGIEIEDKIPLTEEEKTRMFIDILPELGPDDGVAYVSFYQEPGVDLAELRSKVEEALNELSLFTDLGSREITVSETEDIDWMNNWKEFFKPFRVDDEIVIKPTWEKIPDDCKDTDLVIEIDPGTAFGTGAHETTKLCILDMKANLKAGDRLLDIGCGSGILSVIGRKLGAEFVAGVDVDPNAVLVSAENAKENRLSVAVKDSNFHLPKENPETLAFLEGNVLEDGLLCSLLGLGAYDMVVANILANIIIPLCPVAYDFLKPGGLFISSGILKVKEEAVKEAVLGSGFELLRVRYMGDWVSITARK